ncbi:MAG: XdhC family protein [Lachnospiraceae bacterium]|nr:XdhC family protein [Lachnospiraceae bacterium]
MFDNIISKAFEYIEASEDLELVKIIKSSATGTPRKEGAFMFVDTNGESFGTVGGGNIEYQATLYAKSLLMEKKDGEKVYNLSQKEAENIGMVCGGESHMQFIYLTNDERSREILDTLKEANKSKNIVYIFGAGHVSMELAKVLHYVGFETVIWDDRIDFANTTRFPDSKKVICKSYDNVKSEINITNNDFVVIMTRGHAYDYIVEKQVLDTDAYYIGVIGSANKNKVLREKLQIDGYSEEKINGVCAPIGIPIAADTPEEIAISIASEIILFRSRMENRRKVSDDNEIVKLYKNRGIKL